MNQQASRFDSDEETPAAVTNAAASSVNTLLPSSDLPRDLTYAMNGKEESLALDELCSKLKARYEAMTSLPSCVPAVVSLCVGGKNFSVSRALIEKDPGSVLFVLTLEHFAPSSSRFRSTSASSLRGGKRDRGDVECAASKAAAETAIAVPERIPETFGMLLNMLRGYRNAIPVEWMDACREEAAYYGLEGSWNARFHVLPTPYYFRNPLHSSKILSDAVLGVASDFLTSGEQHIDFSVVQCDRVGVGVISTTGGSLEELGPQTQDGNNGAFYWNDGKLSFYMGEPRMVETGFPFPAGALIRVVFDADERIIRWIVNGEYCVAIERLPSGRRYAFSSIASRSSQVTIVPL
ncbi:hypothetical protein ABB37_09227 [Leptomonas pyrrhocoris]|uniref:BTB domain-containing protein n=1 Tax=Leptomonas pyrrhocoris TaxID=157538 RepID=A0A0M9FRM0_LEPPY|nr:hypothetical protein ABB37_09227 [Leptomonas pyrrhocoris]KPA74603.1 hypothetical protein ABB37_09227 [Leptomonas pyrrhocoris]|eukprot:XP_015653042.1 hypothetical protein ABB37_09227 [Leptomonas pyrrhocoris]